VTTQVGETLSWWSIKRHQKRMKREWRKEGDLGKKQGVIGLGLVLLRIIKIINRGNQKCFPPFRAQKMSRPRGGDDQTRRKGKMNQNCSWRPARGRPSNRRSWLGRGMGRRIVLSYLGGTSGLEGRKDGHLPQMNNLSPSMQITGRGKWKKRAKD